MYQGDSVWSKSLSSPEELLTLRTDLTHGAVQEERPLSKRSDEFWKRLKSRGSFHMHPEFWTKHNETRQSKLTF